MITPSALNAGTVLQTSGGGGISMGLILLLGVAAIIVIGLVWLLTKQSKGGSD